MVNEKDGSLLVWVPGGTFMSRRETPAERDVSGFYIGLTCVTNAQYRRFEEETNRAHFDLTFDSEQVADYPVTMVNWHEAKAYCLWAGLRLPTTIEWEKAAGGTDGRTYPWGNEWDPEKCRNSVGKNGHPFEGKAEVWRYPEGVSPYGCLQMAGNVWEWCDRMRGDFEGCLPQPVRGGSWSNTVAEHFQCGFGNSDSPFRRFSNNGFRPVKDAC